MRGPWSCSAREREEKERLTEYMDGTLLFYGSTIALQSSHGGFLCLDSHRKANTLVENSRQPNALMKVR